MAKTVSLGVNRVARKAKQVCIGRTETYTVVEYIKSSGGACINTKFLADSNTRIVMDMELESVPSNGAAFFGGRTTTESYSVVAWASSPTSYRSDYCADSKDQVSLSVDSVLGRYIVDKNKNVCKMGTKTLTNTVKTFSCVYPLYLLATNTAGNVIFPMEAKLYSTKIYDNGTPARDYVAVKNSSGTVGLLDRLTNEFYANAGAGTFEAGPETGETITSSLARKVKLVYIGVNGVARLAYGESAADTTVEAGHYWLIDASGIKEYNASGKLLSSSSTIPSTWTCPAEGGYRIELHGKGGKGGNGDYESSMWTNGSTYFHGSGAGGGGGGGGSGAFVNLDLVKGKAYKVALDSSATFGARTVAAGADGTNATAEGGSFASGTKAGTGGAVGTKPQAMTNLATAGSDGAVDYSEYSAYSSAAGGSAGSGGSTIGNYGDGGDGGEVSSSGSAQSGKAGQAGAIIIKRRNTWKKYQVDHTVEWSTEYDGICCISYPGPYTARTWVTDVSADTGVFEIKSSFERGIAYVEAAGNTYYYSKVDPQGYEYTTRRRIYDFDYDQTFGTTTCYRITVTDKSWNSDGGQINGDKLEKGEVKTTVTLVGTVSSDDPNAYPENGMHTDGYWYTAIS